MLTLPDFNMVKSAYDCRLDIHRQLIAYFDASKEKEFVEMAIGITKQGSCNGNYSASEHLLGNKILTSNGYNYHSIFNLAKKLRISKFTHIPKLIYDADISHLKISVGSEMAMMLKPNELWVGNIRTYWVYFLVQEGFNKKGLKAAKDAVNLFKTNEKDSIMEYNVWKYLYLSLKEPLNKLVEEYNSSSSVPSALIPKDSNYLWADAIATHLYEYYMS
jgi:hypothetical protein